MVRSRPRPLPWGVASCESCRAIVTFDPELEPAPWRCAACGGPLEPSSREEPAPFPLGLAGVVILGLALWGWAAYHEPVATAALLAGAALFCYAKSFGDEKRPHGS